MKLYPADRQTMTFVLGRLQTQVAAACADLHKLRSVQYRLEQQDLNKDDVAWVRQYTAYVDQLSMACGNMSAAIDALEEKRLTATE